MQQIKWSTAAEAVAAIQSGDHIHLSSVASVPHILIDALVDRADAGEISDLHFHHFHTEGPAPYASREYEGIFSEEGFFVGPNVRDEVNDGYADYLPVHLSESQKLYRQHIIPLGAALVQVSEPDEQGRVSLGTSVDCSVAAIESARLKIAVVNPHVPFSYGDLIPLTAFDYLVKDDTPLITKDHIMRPTAVERAIGRSCAELVPDGACLQMGIGALPNAVAISLKDHQHLGLHSEMFSDGVLRLIEKGVVDGSQKQIDKGKIVASFLLGSQHVYDFIDHNPDVLMRDIGYVNNPMIIAQNLNFVAINSATEVDLTGQICADSIGTRIYSGTGGQVDFVRGSLMSPGGRSITAFASRTRRGQSKIVPVLHSGAGVVTSRADAHWICTEYGAVNLFGRSLQERAKLLTSIAHPDDREALDRAAYERFGPHYHNFSV